MKIVILGLSLSSSWGNGHATTYRALLRELGARHDILFLEREQEWYAAHRDLARPSYCTLKFYHGVDELDSFRPDIEAADAVIIGSYVAEGRRIAKLIFPWVRGAFCFYDIDTPVTLSRLDDDAADYVGADVIPLYDIYFSFTGGPTLRRLEEQFCARRAEPLYCGVDETVYRPMEISKQWDVGYMGTYSPDRQPGLERLLLEPARLAPDKKFVVAGPMYPETIAWPANVERIEHLPPDRHAAFYNAQDFTLNLTRADMARAGYSPSVRLFEAAACGVPVITDQWPGIETIFLPDEEIILAGGGSDVLAALALPEARRRRIGAAARAKCLAAHTAAHRAAELEAALRSLPAIRQQKSFQLAGVSQ